MFGLARNHFKKPAIKGTVIIPTHGHWPERIGIILSAVYCKATAAAVAPTTSSPCKIVCLKTEFIVILLVY